MHNTGLILVPQSSLLKRRRRKENLDMSMSMMTTVGGVGAGAPAPASAGVFFGSSCGSVPIGAVESPAQNASDKEENAIDDGEDPASLEHGARSIERCTPAVTARVAVIAKLKANRHVDAGTIGVANTSVQNDTCNPSTDESNVDDSDERARHATISVKLV